MKYVLVVDDEPHVIRALTLALESDGYAVTGVRDGQEALQRICSDQPDAVVTDIQMPQMSGQTLCERIREAVPERSFPIVVMTSRVERELREWAEGFPLLEFMEKPVSPRKLARLLASHLTAEAPGGPGARG